MKLKKYLSLLTAILTLCAMTSCRDKNSSTMDESSLTETTAARTEITTETSIEVTASTTPEDNPAQVDKNAITFNESSLYTAHALGSEGEAPIDLSIVDLKGNKKLRVRVSKDDESPNYGTAKIAFDLPALVGAENVRKVDHFSVDFTCIARGTYTFEDGSFQQVIGHFKGALGGNYASPTVDAQNWAQQEFQFNEMDSFMQSWHYETKSLAENEKYAENDNGVNLVIMRYDQPNDVDFYIDNITVYDQSGNSMPIVYDVTVEKEEISISTDGITEDGLIPADDGWYIVPDNNQTTVEPAQTEPEYDEDGNIILRT